MKVIIQGHSNEHIFVLDAILLSLLLFLSLWYRVFATIHIFSVADILLLPCMVHLTLYIVWLYICTFQSMCTVSDMAVFSSFFDFMLSRCVAQVFSEWFWGGSSGTTFVFKSTWSVCLLHGIIIIIIIIPNPPNVITSSFINVCLGILYVRRAEYTLKFQHSRQL